MSAGSLRQQLRLCEANVNMQLQLIRDECKRNNVAAFNLKYADGTYVLPPLLLAQSNILLALATLEGKK